MRFILIMFGATLGLALGGLQGWLVYHFKGPFAHDSFGEMFMIFAPVATFMSAIYNTEKIGLWLLNRHDEVEAINLSSMRFRILAMNVLTLVLLIASFFVK